MKKLRFNKFLMATVALAVFAISYIGGVPPLKAADEMNKATCTIDVQDDTPNVYGSIRRVAHFFNNTGALQFCKEEWKITTDIYLGEPLVISGIPGEKKVGEELERELVIDGGGHTIHVGNIKSGCAITVETTDVVIKNLNIRGKNVSPVETGSGEEGEGEGEGGVEKGVNGLCITSHDNTLEGVMVGYMSGKGILVTSQGNVIKGLKKEGGDTSYRGSGAFRNADIGIDLAMSGDGDVFNKVDPHLIIFGNTGERQLRVASSDVKVVLQGSGAEGEYYAYGQVSKNGQAFAPYAMLVYKVQPDFDKEFNQLTVGDVLVGYIRPGEEDQTETPTETPEEGEEEEGKAPEQSGQDEFTGIVNNLTDAYIDESGNFGFTLSKADENSHVFVVVYPYKYMVASSSNSCVVSGQYVWECGDVDLDVNLTPPDDGVGVEKDDTHAWTNAACKELGPKPTHPMPYLYDSDDDGIPDQLEDIDFTCDKTGNHETSARDPDSDGDGILDGMEDLNRNGFVDCYMPAEEDECGQNDSDTSENGTTEVDCKKHTDGKWYKLVRPEYQTDVPDSQLYKYEIPKLESMDRGVPKAYDPNDGFCDETNPRVPDSDKDGINDGIEDRSDPFHPKASAHMYYLREITEGSLFSDKNKVLIDDEQEGELAHKNCSNMMIEKMVGGETVYNELGVVYIFKQKDPADKASKKFLNLVCVNDSVTNINNFNGEYNSGAGETNATKFDTDSDGLCDGLGCANHGFKTEVIQKDKDGNVKKDVDGNPLTEEVEVKVKDKCPNIWDPTNSCYEECYPGKIKNDLPAGITIEEIKELMKSTDMAARAELDKLDLMDSDNDGIPDVVENPSMECAKGKYGYDAFTTNNVKAECPIGTGGECNKELVNFASAENAIIWCYIDRDEDRLFDCEEDKNGDTIIDKSLWESNPLDKNTDSDNLEDGVEILDMGDTMLGKTNPSMPDTDNDGINDDEEVKFGNKNLYEKVSDGFDGVCDVLGNDTDPTNPDTDGDGLQDDLEIYKMGTSPNDVDSDNDGLCDGVKVVEGKCTGAELLTVPATDDYKPMWNESDPCNDDTDGDGWKDGVDKCPGVFDEANTCEGVGEYGKDSDNDGLPDSKEKEMGTKWDPKDNSDSRDAKDSDGDGLVDGCINNKGELCNAVRDNLAALTASGSQYYHNCSRPDFLDCDTDPNNPDSDGDSINDKAERDYGTDPWDTDTDDDCIPDGPMMLANGTFSEGEDRNRNGKRDGDETRAASELTVMLGPDGLEKEDMWLAIDTDGDGIPDGRHQAYASRCEDCNCNGIWDHDDRGLPIELNPLSWDTDNDGIDDLSEMMVGGFYNPANLNHALFGRRGGCSMVAGAPADMSLVIILVGLILTAVVIRRRMKKVKA